MSSQLPSFEAEDSFDELQPDLPYVLNRRWEVVDKLGQGGMGTVYMARDLNLPNLNEQKRACVVKQLRDDFFREEDREKALLFFQREAQVLSTLNHANIVRVLDFFSEHDRQFLVMEYVQGQNLHEMVIKRQMPFPEEDVVDWAVQICDVLQYLHTHKPPVIYRDLKPSNIMIDVNDQVKLVDFGIARPFSESEDNTHVVSQGYSPPEQYWGAADPRSDIYALGCTMHFLLTGQDPLALTVASPRQVNEEVSDRVNQIVERATQQDLWSRYQSALEMKDELTYEVEIPKPASINPVIATGALVLASGLVLGGVLLYTHLVDEHNNRTKVAEDYEKLRVEYEQKSHALKQEEKRREKAENAIRTTIKKTSVLPKYSTVPTSAGKKSEPGPKLPAFPIFEENDERVLTDPEGLD